MFFLATTPAFAGSGNNSTGDWIVGLLLLAFLFLVYKTILFVVRKLGLKLPTNVITHGSPIVVLLGAFFVLSLGTAFIDIAIALKSLSNINTYLPFFGSDVKSAAQIAIEQGLISSQFNTSPEIEELLGSCGLAKILSNVVFIVVLAFAAVQIYGVRKVGKVKRDTLLNLQIIGSAIVILAVLFDFYVLNEVLDVILPLRDKNNASFLVIFAIGFVIAFHVFRSYSEKTAEIFGITVEEQPQTEEATTTEAESEQEQGQDKESWFEKNRNVFVGGLAGLIVLILAIILFKNCGGNQTPVQHTVFTEDSLDAVESNHEEGQECDETSNDMLLKCKKSNCVLGSITQGNPTILRYDVDNDGNIDEIIFKIGGQFQPQLYCKIGNKEIDLPFPDEGQIGEWIDDLINEPEPIIQDKPVQLSHYDFAGDGIEELIVNFTDGGATNSCAIYQFTGGVFKCIGEETITGTKSMYIKNGKLVLPIGSQGYEETRAIQKGKIVDITE